MEVRVELVVRKQFWKILIGLLFITVTCDNVGVAGSTTATTSSTVSASASTSATTSVSASSSATTSVSASSSATTSVSASSSATTSVSASSSATTSVSASSSATTSVSVSSSADSTSSAAASSSSSAAATSSASSSVSASVSASASSSVSASVSASPSSSVQSNNSVSASPSSSVQSSNSVSASVSSSVAPTTGSPLKPSCFNIKFVANTTWNASFTDKNSDAYKDFSKMTSDVLKALFNDTTKYDDVEVSDEKYAEKDSLTKVEAKLCLVVKTNVGTFIADVLEKKVNTGKLHPNYRVMVDSAEFIPLGVTFKEWKAKEGECARICEKAGGKFEIERVCEASSTETCNGVKNTDTSDDCVKYCPDNGGAFTNVSFFILAIGFFLSFSFQ